jgi:hypothetical protein
MAGAYEELEERDQADDGSKVGDCSHGSSELVGVSIELNKKMFVSNKTNPSAFHYHSRMVPGTTTPGRG